MPLEIRDRNGNHLTVQELRERLNMTRQDLALKLGVSERTISRWEKQEPRIGQANQRQLNGLANRK